VRLIDALAAHAGRAAANRSRVTASRRSAVGCAHQGVYARRSLFIIGPAEGRTRWLAMSGREISIGAPRRVRRAHAQRLNLPRDFAWARRFWRLCQPYPRFRELHAHARQISSKL
jgi:hypothetical protein